MTKTPKYEIGQKVWALSDNNGVYSTVEVMVHNIHINSDGINYVVRGTLNAYAKNHSEGTLFQTVEDAHATINDLRNKQNILTDGVICGKGSCRISYEDCRVVIRYDSHSMSGNLAIGEISRNDCVALSKFFEELSRQ